MIAKRLEAILADEAGKTDFSHRSSADMVQRFQALRGYGLLPRGRGKNAQQLSLSEVVAGILSLSTEKPGYSGLASKVLKKLRPVGGVEASFEGCGTFGKAIEAILDNSDALTSLVEVRVSGSEIYNNGYGRAVIKYRSGDTQKTAFHRRDCGFLISARRGKNFESKRSHFVGYQRNYLLSAIF